MSISRRSRVVVVLQRLSLVLGIALAVGAAFDEDQPLGQQPLDIWILSGQSNMQGDNMRDWQPMPECGTPWPDKIFSYPQGNSTWHPEWIVATPNVCWFASMHREDTTSIGPEMAFAKALISRGASHKVGFVPVTYGGSNLYSDWREKSAGLLGVLLAQVNFAMVAAGPFARLRGMVWVQGEGDATVVAGRAHAAMYGENMRRLVGIVRDELKHLHPMLPVITAVQATTDRDRVLPYIGLVRRHQQELDMPALLKVDMEGLEMLPDDFTEMYGADVGIQRLHITKRAMCMFGEQLADVYIQNRQQLDAPGEGVVATGGASVLIADGVGERAAWATRTGVGA